MGSMLLQMLGNDNCIVDIVIERKRLEKVLACDEPLDSNWDELFPPIIDTSSWKFNREEANER